MTIASRDGDDGNTRIPGGRRVPKDDPRLLASGSADELISMIGWVRAGPLPVRLDAMLRRIQSDLVDLSAEFFVMREGPTEPAPAFPVAAMNAVESYLRMIEDRLPPSTEHLLPGGHEGAARLGLARTACRRAEREVVSLARHLRIPGSVLRYINRLGDLLFVMAREVNQDAGVPDPRWEPRESREIDG